MQRKDAHIIPDMRTAGFYMIFCSLCWFRIYMYICHYIHIILVFHSGFRRQPTIRKVWLGRFILGGGESSPAVSCDVKYCHSNVFQSKGQREPTCNFRMCPIFCYVSWWFNKFQASHHHHTQIAIYPPKVSHGTWKWNQISDMEIIRHGNHQNLGFYVKPWGFLDIQRSLALPYGQSLVTSPPSLGSRCWNEPVMPWLKP